MATDEGFQAVPLVKDGRGSTDDGGLQNGRRVEYVEGKPRRETDYNTKRSNACKQVSLWLVFIYILSFWLIPICLPPQAYTMTISKPGFAQENVTREALQSWNPQVLVFNASAYRTWGLFLGIIFMILDSIRVYAARDEEEPENEPCQFLGSCRMGNTPFPIFGAVGWLMFALGLFVDNQGGVAPGGRSIVHFVIVLVFWPLFQYWGTSLMDKRAEGEEVDSSAFTSQGFWMPWLSFLVDLFLAITMGYNNDFTGVKLNGACMVLSVFGFCQLWYGGMMSSWDAKRGMYLWLNGRGASNPDYKTHGPGGVVRNLGWVFIFLANVLGEPWQVELEMEQADGSMLMKTVTSEDGVNGYTLDYISYAIPVSGRAFWAFLGAAVLISAEFLRQYAFDEHYGEGNVEMRGKAGYCCGSLEDGAKRPLCGCGFFESPWFAFLGWMIMGFAMFVHPITGQLVISPRNDVCGAFIFMLALFHVFIFQGACQRGGCSKDGNGFDSTKMFVAMVINFIFLSTAGFCVVMDIELKDLKDDGESIGYMLIALTLLMVKDFAPFCCCASNKRGFGNKVDLDRGRAFNLQGFATVWGYMLFATAVCSDMNTNKNGYYTETWKDEFEVYPWYAGFDRRNWTDDAGYGRAEVTADGVVAERPVRNEYYEAALARDQEKEREATERRTSGGGPEKDAAYWLKYGDSDETDEMAVGSAGSADDVSAATGKAAYVAMAVAFVTAWIM